MTPFVKLRSQPRTDDLFIFLGRYIPRRKRQDVGVVMLAGELGYLLVPGDGGANAGHFVSGYRHSRARAADENSLIGRSACNAFADLFGVVGVVDRFG